MDNTRYVLLSRLGAVAGLVAALVLLVNAAKRAGLVETTTLTQLAAPVAQLAAVVLFIALAVAAGPRGWRLVAGLAGVVSIASLVGVEVVLNLVFAQLPATTIAELRAGPLGIALTIASLAFLVTTVGIVAAWWRVAPRWALVAYAAGGVVVALRTFVPEAVLDVALVVMAIGVAGVAVDLLRSRGRAAQSHSLASLHS